MGCHFSERIVKSGSERVCNRKNEIFFTYRQLSQVRIVTAVFLLLLGIMRKLHDIILQYHFK